MKLKVLVLLLFLALSACSGATKLVAKAALGGIGLPTAASAQVGKTNTQTIGLSENTEFVIKDVVNSSVRPIMRPTGITTTDKVDTINQTNNNVPLGFILFFIVWSILLWELPRFSTILEYFRNRKKTKE